MGVVLNIIVIALIGLIAYWWANQGFFSALLHLACVVIAGAIAFSLWEPVTTAFLLKGKFASYAWGVGLIGVFVLTLVILRVTLDRTIRANVALPDWANLTFGGICGIGSGILAVGIALMGCGMMHSTQRLFNLKLVQRDGRGEVKTVDKLWVPAHQLTSDFYSWLSVGSLRTGTPMAQYYPSVYKQTSLLRDGYTKRDKLIGGITLPPKSVDVKRVVQSRDGGREYYSVEIEVSSEGFDDGRGLSIASSQAQLIGTTSSRFDEAPAAFPTRWTQPTKDQGVKTFDFDNRTHYATNVAGKEIANIVLHFPKADLPAGSTPRFLLLKGVRFRLPALPGTAMASLPAPGESSTRNAVTIDPSAPTIRPDELIVNRRMQGVLINMNTATGLEVDRKQENGIISADAIVPKHPGMQTPRALRVNSFVEGADEAIVQVKVDRNSVASIFGPARDAATADGTAAAPMLIDDQGNRYTAVGYIHFQSDNKVRIWYDPTNRLKDIEDVPYLPTAGTEEMRLVFSVTAGTRLIGFVIGDQTVCQMNVAANKTR